MLGGSVAVFLYTRRQENVNKLSASLLRVVIVIVHRGVQSESCTLMQAVPTARYGKRLINEGDLHQKLLFARNKEQPLVTYLKTAQFVVCNNQCYQAYTHYNSTICLHIGPLRLISHH